MANVSLPEGQFLGWYQLPVPTCIQKTPGPKLVLPVVSHVGIMPPDWSRKAAAAVGACGFGYTTLGVNYVT